EIGQGTLAGMRRAGGETGVSCLIPEGHARVVVFALIPTGALVSGVFVGGNPAEMLESDFDSGIKHDGIIEVPAVRGGMTAHDPPLIEIRNTEVWRARGLEPPGGEEIVLGTGAPDRSFGLAVDVDFLVAFAEPGGAAGPDRQHSPDIMAFALGFEHDVVLAVLHGIFLPVLRVKVGR